MKIVADESVDFGIIIKLRSFGIEVNSIAESTPGIKDTEVLETALNQGLLLVTEDKDFFQYYPHQA